MHLRRARSDEAETVGAVTVAAYDANGYLVRPDGSYDHGYAEWLAGVGDRIETDVVMVAADDDTDEVLGAVTWAPFGSPSSELAFDPSHGEFRTLAVAPAARGRGVGRALVGWCLDEARRQGLSEVWLSSLPEMTTAHHLYRSLGFERAPDRDWEPEPGVVLWAFRLDLGAHGSGGEATLTR